MHAVPWHLLRLTKATQTVNWTAVTRDEIHQTPPTSQRRVGSGNYFHETGRTPYPRYSHSAQFAR